MELNPVPVLMSMIIYSNIGGAITPVGDPPNVILASHKEVIKAVSSPSALRPLFSFDSANSNWFPRRVSTSASSRCTWASAR